MLEQLGFWRLVAVYFSPDLGPVAYDFGNREGSDVRPYEVFYHAELINYFNPLKTEKARVARWDYRLLQ